MLAVHSVGLRKKKKDHPPTRTTGKCLKLKLQEWKQFKGKYQQNSVSCWIFISMLCNCISINNCVQCTTIMTSIRSFSEKIRLQTLYCTDPNFFFLFFFSLCFLSFTFIFFFFFLFLLFLKLSNLQQEVYKGAHQNYNHKKTDPSSTQVGGSLTAHW